ncbi:hypothetical protein EIP75_00055 [Aquabacterium soli]|uniref:ABC-2 type transport system permease protein n=1 Tax=Aquabacterium soli TaxID=2493092 RepID=A0A3R8SAG8_9BURK|nr:hypothetical protein [Aquabacterium soli]RRS06044.1 hypothetical protein EIP75_00055 [Aquabacterium soli]
MIYRLLALRLRWYSEATALLLLRRWQAIVLILGTFTPVGGSLLREAAYPVMVLLSGQHGVIWLMGALGLWQGFWALWALMQREQVRGGRFADFAQSFPLPHRTCRVVDLVVLLVSDTPLLIPFVASALALAASDSEPWVCARGALVLVFMLASQLCAQLAVLKGRTAVIAGFVLVDAWVATAIGLPMPPFGSVVLLTLPTLASLGALIANVPPLSPRTAQALRQLTQAGEDLVSWLLRPLSPMVRLSLGVLYRQHLSSMLAKFFTCMLIVFASAGLMSVWDFDGRCLPMAFIAAGLTALATSGLYRPLQMAHEAALPFTAALPLAPRWWRWADTLVVLSFGAPFALCLGGYLVSNAGLSILTAVGFLISFLLLVAALRPPQLFSNRHAVLASTVLASLWTFGAASVIHP